MRKETGRATGREKRLEGEGRDVVLHALYEQARDFSRVQGSPRGILRQEKEPPNNVQRGEQYRESNSSPADREVRGGREG